MYDQEWIEYPYECHKTIISTADFLSQFYVVFCKQWFQIIWFEALTSIFLTTGWGNPPLTILVRDLNLHLLPLSGSCHAQAIPKAKAPRHGRATDMWMLDEPRILLDKMPMFFENISSSLEDHLNYLQAMENIYFVYVYLNIFKYTYILILYIYNLYIIHILSSAPPIKFQ